MLRTTPSHRSSLGAALAFGASLVFCAAAAAQSTEAPRIRPAPSIAPSPTQTIAESAPVEGAARVWRSPPLYSTAVTIGRPPFYTLQDQSPPIRRTVFTVVKINAVNVGGRTGEIRLRCLDSRGAVLKDYPPATAAPNAIVSFELEAARDLDLPPQSCQLTSTQPVIAGGLSIWRELQGAGIQTEINTPFVMYVVQR